MYIGNNVITSYYKANIVIVNDKNVKTGTTFKNKRFTIYTTADEAGMQFAANEYAITSLTTKKAILLLQTPRKMRKESNS